MSIASTLVAIELHAERRGRRVAFAGAAITAAAIAAIAPAQGNAHHNTIAWCATAAVAWVLVVVACEGMPRDQRGGQLELHRRLPAGILWTGGAKIAAAGGVTAMAAALAVLVGAFTLGALHDVPLGTTAPLAVRSGLAAAVAGCGICGLGVAVSTWLPRGSLAAAATALLAATAIMPFLLARATNGWFAPPRTDLALLLIGVLPALGLAVAWRSLAGLRWSSGAVGPAHGGIPVALAGIALLSGWYWARADAWDRVRPLDPRFTISSGVVGAGAQRAFLDVLGAGGRYALTVDLENGDYWQQRGALVGTLGLDHRSPGQHAIVLRSRHTGDDPDGWQHELLDGTSGGRIAGPGPLAAIVAAHAAAAHRSLRDNAPFRRRDGRRVWWLLQVPYVDDGGAWTAMPWAPGLRPWVRRGDAVKVDGHTKIYDIHSGRLWDDTGPTLRNGWCRAGHWLVPRLDRQSATPAWDLLDPTDGARRACPVLDGVDRIVANLDNDRVLAHGIDGAVWCIHPEGNHRRAVTLRGAPLRTPRIAWPAVSPVWTPTGQAVLTASLAGRPTIVRLDPHTAMLTPGPAAPAGEVMACIDDDTLIVHTKSTVERWGFTPASRTVLFPRGEGVAR